MLEAFQFGALLLTVLFAGGALYLSLIEHPARMRCGVDAAVMQFKVTYVRGAPLTTLFVLIAALCGLGAWALSGDALWLIGSALSVAVMLYTLAMIRPAIDRIVAIGDDDDDETMGARQLLRNWGRRHAVRTVISLAAAAAVTWAATFH